MLVYEKPVGRVTWLLGFIDLRELLVRDQVVEMRQAREKRCLAPTGMVESLHGEEFAVDGVVRLIQHGAHRRHLWGCEHRIPAGFLVLEPLANALAMRFAYRRG